jgi:hypothetical protein
MKQITFIEALDEYLDIRQVIADNKSKGRKYAHYIEFEQKARQVLIDVYAAEKIELLKQAGVIVK